MGKAEPGSKKSAAKKTASTKGEAKAEKPATETAVKKTATKAKAAETAKATKPAKPDVEQTVSAPPVEPEPVEAAPVETAPVETATPEARAAADLDNAVLPAGRGKVALFGGPKDRAIKPDDKVALPIGRHFTYDRVRSLDSRGYYCAMRWNYRFSHMTPEEAKRWWANKKLLVTNAKNGSTVEVRAVDYGPHENTGLDIGISPGAAEALEVEVGDEVDIALADSKSPLGPLG